MGFTKHATFDSSEILDIKGSYTRLGRTANLDKVSTYTDYRTDQGYIYARIRAISSRVNRNNDGWPSIELAGSPEIFDRHQSSAGGFTVNASQGDKKYGFATFVGKPIFVDHHNTDPEDTRGVIVDAKLHVEDTKTAASLDPYYASAPDNHKPPTWVELLLEVDAKEFPKFAKALIDGAKDPKKGIDGFSMGCDVEYTICSHCENKAESPDDFCEHVKLKGAHLKSKKTGKMEKAYEDCYGVGFFEISGVFDPADETALTREVRSSMLKEAPGNKHLPYATDKENRMYEHIKQSCLDRGGSEEACKREAASTVNKYRSEHGETKSNVHTADNPAPQEDHLKAPEPVDTLREDKICPICGSNYDGATCEVCGYVEPPDGLNNPDLERAQEENPELGSGDKQEEENVTELPEANKGVPDRLESDKPGQSYLDARNDGTTSHVTSEMAWKASNFATSRKINKAEVPILSGNPPQSNEPPEAIISDPQRPTTRTATNQENNMSTKVAADPLPDARADKRVDVTGVGGVDQANNEAASKADAQVDVVGVGTTGISDVEADEHDSINETSDNAGFDQGGDRGNNSGPTKTWSGQDEQTNPVTSETPYWVEESKWSATHVGYDDGTLEQNEQQGNKPVGQGGTAVKGTQPVDPVGKPDERVNLLEHVTSPENNSGETKTWSGTDGNGVTRQQDPVTNDSIARGESGLEGAPNWSRINSHVVAVFKLADAEVDAGIITKEQKWERVAQLENQSQAEIVAQHSLLDRVKTAGLTRAPIAGRVPSLKTAGTETKESEVPVEDELDAAIFSRFSR